MLKFFLATGLLFSMVITTAPINAQTVEDNTYNISPRKLISLARQGRFKEQGIPGYSNFGNGIRSGRITAEVLVESAIAQSRLPKTAKSDRNYLSTVANHLSSGGCSSI